jgi:hypothetical protein
MVDDYVITRKDGNDLFSRYPDMFKPYAYKISMTELDIARYINNKLSLWKRIYRKLCPIRYHVNKKVKSYMICSKIRVLIDQMDKVLAWGGNEHPQVSKPGEEIKKGVVDDV